MNDIKSMKWNEISYEDLKHVKHLKNTDRELLNLWFSKSKFLLKLTDIY